MVIECAICDASGEPRNAYSKVHDLRETGRDFPVIKVEYIGKAFMFAPPVPLQSLFGTLQLSRQLWGNLWTRQS